MFFPLTLGGYPLGITRNKWYEAFKKKHPSQKKLSENMSKGHTIFWKWNILWQIPFFLKKNQPKLKRFVLGEVLSHLCLLATILRVPWNSVGS
jgi:hypothetical protein